MNTLNTIKQVAAISVFTVVISSTSLLNNTSHAGEIIFDDNANMKISRLITRSRVLKNTRGQDIVEDDPSQQAQEGVDSIGTVDCTGIDIANQSAPRPGQSARATEVYILGDVINANNSC